MSAIFDFSSVVMILLLMICTCTYLREMRPAVFDGGKVSVCNAWEVLYLFAMSELSVGCRCLFVARVGRGLFVNPFTNTNFKSNNKPFSGSNFFFFMSTL